MDLNTSKYLGGVGALLMFIGAIVSSYSLGILALIGLIMLLIGLHGFADHYRESGIFNNGLYGTIAAIVGVVAVVAIIFTSLIGFFQEIAPGWNGDWTSISQINPADISTNISLDTVGSFVGTILLAGVIGFVFIVVVAVLFRKSFGLLREKTGVGLFGTTGTVLLVGAVLTIAFGIGLILVWIAMLLLAIAFFQVKEQPAQPAYQAPYQTTPPPPPTQM